MKHTKGPWRQHGEIINSDSREIAIIPNYSSKKDNANARLIASAPEMLKVITTVHGLANLQALLETKYSKALVFDLMKQMENVITKARGEK